MHLLGACSLLEVFAQGYNMDIRKAIVQGFRVKGSGLWVYGLGLWV